MKKLEILFLLSAALVIIFLHIFYFREICYDRDLSFYTYNTLDVLKDHGWYYSPWHTKLPGINFIILAAFKLFGQSFKSIYLAALFFNLTALFLIYLIAKKLLSKETKIYFILPVIFINLFAAEIFLTYTANTEVFLAAFEIAGILFLGLNRYFIAGLLFGSGFLIRQTAFLPFISGALFLIIINLSGKKSFKELIKKLLIMGLGFILPLILIAIYFLAKGVFDKLVNYAFIYNLRNFGEYIIDIRQRDLKSPRMLFWVSKYNFEIILLSFLSLWGLFYTIIRRTKISILVSCWFIISFLWLLVAGIYPHHFIELIAPLACISLLGISDIFEKIKRLTIGKPYLHNIFIVVIISVLIIPCIRLIIPFITNERRGYPLQFREDRFYAARYIKEHSFPQDKLFVWDNFSLGAIFLWSQRDSIIEFHEKYAFLPVELREYMVPYVEDYPLNQKKLLFALQKEKPKYIVLVNDYNKVIRWRKLAKRYAASREAWEVLSKHPLDAEKEAFPDFFSLLNKDYRFEKEIGICRIYRLIK